MHGATADRADRAGAREVAARALRLALGSDIDATSGPLRTGSWSDVLRDRAGSHLLLSPRAPLLAMASAIALEDAIAGAVACRAAAIDWDRMPDVLTAARHADDAAPQPMFVRIASGWVSVVTPPADADLWRALLDTTATADELTRRAQEYRIACLPVAPAARDWERCRGISTPPTPVSPREWLIGGDGSLAGSRVVDVGVLISAPFACAILAALGATVTAVAHPARAASRWYGPVPLPVDLETVAGRTEFQHLCAEADLVVDNFAPGVWSRLGMDPVGIGARAHVSLPAFPRGDPRRSYRAYGSQTGSLFGVDHAPASDAGSPSAGPASGLMDHCVGAVAAIRCIAALTGRRPGRSEVTHAEIASLVL